MNREERARAAVALRAQGFKLKDIASTLGISYSYAQDLCADPDGSKVKARKDSYRGVCENCGAKTDGSNGRANAPKKCLACAASLATENRYWTRERVLEGIRRFVRENGRKPLSHEWLTSGHGQNGDGYPYTSVVLREFGTWNEAMAAAGLPTEGRGKYERTPETLAKLGESQGERWGYGNRSKKAREYAAEFNGEPVRRDEVVAECRRRGITSAAWTKAAAAEGLVLYWGRLDAGATDKRRRFARLLGRAA